MTTKLKICNCLWIRLVCTAIQRF